MNDPDIVIRVANLSKTFEFRENSHDSIREKVLNLNFRGTGIRKLKALKDINFEVKRGEIFGIIGKNGSGKSTLLKIILGAYKGDKGTEVDVKGKVIRLALGMGFDPNLSARENIYVNGSILGLSFKKIGNIFHDIIRFAGLEDYVDTPIKFYSSGMQSRLAFSIAIYAEADIFLIDEFFGGVGDESFKEKSEAVFKETILEKRTILLVSHQLNTIAKHCHRVMVLEKGEVLAIGSPEEVIEVYKKSFRNEVRKKF